MFGWRSENIISISRKAFSSVVLRKILHAAVLFRNVAVWTFENAPCPMTSPS